MIILSVGSNSLHCGNKIKRIREGVDRPTPEIVLEFKDVAGECQFTMFASVSVTGLIAFVGPLYFKFCGVDPIPGCTKKDCFTTVSSVIMSTTFRWNLEYLLLILFRCQ